MGKNKNIQYVDHDFFGDKITKKQLQAVLKAAEELEATINLKLRKKTIKVNPDSNISELLEASNSTIKTNGRKKAK